VQPNVALLSPNTLALLPARSQASPDRAPDHLAGGTPAALRDDLIALVGSKAVLARVTDLVRYATDASPYRLFPQVVIVPETANDIAAVLQYARETHHTVTFRASGSSLSGQSQGDDILIDVRKAWSGIEVLEDGKAARIKPGTIVDAANRVLHRYERILGPDPASSGIATVGGVVANNASGMTAGTRLNSYHTVRSMKILLASGTLIDTADPVADFKLQEAEPQLYNGLLELRDEIRADAELAARIRKKYAVKNNNGYRLDAFLDETSAAAIVQKLMVGSEGTLGFLMELTFETVPLRPLRSTGLLIFKDLQDAAAAAPKFVEAGAMAAELMDGRCLHFAGAIEGVPKSWEALSEDVGALLVEFRGSTEAELADMERTGHQLINTLQLQEAASFTRDAKAAALYWKVRDGLYPIVASGRTQGTILMIEDICVAQSRVGEAANDIIDLLRKHGYDPNIAGHASAGNLHFLIGVNFGKPIEVDRYAAFMEEMTTLIVSKYDGSLKAEHGTGRNIAPFLEREWGPKATDLMWQVKKLFDPEGLLAPGVMLNKDPQGHLKHTHTFPEIEHIANACIECGFCEPVCPSRHLTTTPRQRIALRREMMRQEPGAPVQQALLREYEYDAIQTCAGDSSCSMACPVEINTGMLMKQFRHIEHSRREERVATWIAENWGKVEPLARGSMLLGNLAAALLGDGTVIGMMNIARKGVSADLLPNWMAALPMPASSRLPRTGANGAAAIYFPACINRIFGSSKRGKRRLSLPQALVTASQRAGKPLYIPPDVVGNCCATIWHSKGYNDGNTLMANRVTESMWRWSQNGTIPIVCDASSCTLGLTHEVLAYLTPENRDRHRRLKIYDSLTWIDEQLMPGLSVTKKAQTATAHVTCSMRTLGIDATLQKITNQLTEEPFFPLGGTCCAFAGDRGLLHEELTRSATQEEAAELRGRDIELYLSANRTCEVGMEHATNEPYESIVFAVEELTREK
jgi:D-lactate dehydrogenase